LPGIGLDIGCRKTRLIWVEKKEAGLRLLKYGSILTPSGAVEGGTIVDPDYLGEELRGLVKDLKLGGKRVVSAVGGQQIYFRNITMPSFGWEELQSAVYYQAMKFLPIPLQEAAIDIYPLREIELEKGKHTELFFLAVRKQQVENLKVTCVRAGLKLAVAEIEPLALYRVLGDESEKVTAILSMGFERSHITVFKQGVPVFYRPINVGSSAFYQPLPLAAVNNRGWGETSVLDEPTGEYMQTDLIREIKGVIEYYALRSETEDESIEKIWLCGAGLTDGWESTLSQDLGVEVETANILPRLILPPHINHLDKRELQTDYQVALGLAAREGI
jgi:type IV pilus assembly protein PilM